MNPYHARKYRPRHQITIPSAHVKISDKTYRKAKFNYNLDTMFSHKFYYLGSSMHPMRRYTYLDDGYWDSLCQLVEHRQNILYKIKHAEELLARASPELHKYVIGDLDGLIHYAKWYTRTLRHLMHYFIKHIADIGHISENEQPINYVGPVEWAAGLKNEIKQIIYKLNKYNIEFRPNLHRITQFINDLIIAEYIRLFAKFGQYSAVSAELRGLQIQQVNNILIHKGNLFYDLRNLRELYFLNRDLFMSIFERKK